jgi:hypothetical protein
VSDDTFKINGCICAHLPIIDNFPAAVLFRLKLIIVVRLRLGIYFKLAGPWNYSCHRSVATIRRDKLNRLYTRVAPGRPLTSHDLALLGISAELAVHYVLADGLDGLGAASPAYAMSVRIIAN